MAISFLENLKSSIVFKEINDTSAQIITQAKMPNGKYIALALEKIDGKWILSDKKQTIKFMNTLYELKAPDVISCINNVTKIYKIKIKDFSLTYELEDEKSLVNKVFEFVMCIAQLVNMFAFFDAPNQ